MTPEQCIQRLARRLGFTPMDGSDTSFEKTLPERKGWTSTVFLHEPKFLKSIDALRPVLATMTEEEWLTFHEILARKHLAYAGSTMTEMLKTLLTLDPQQLAFAIAEALTEEKV